MENLSDVYWYGRKIKGVIFDLDGTLVDSIELYYDVFRDAAAKVGILVKKEDVLEPMATGSFIWDRAIPDDVPDRKSKIMECMRVIPSIYKRAIKRVQIFPSVESVLATLKERGIKMGLVTSSWSDALYPIRHGSLIEYFQSIITRDDGFPPKPFPDSMRECLKRMNVCAESALTVGDSPLDIRAGKECGMLTVGVLTGIGNRIQLEAEHPTAIIKDIHQILSVLDIKDMPNIDNGEQQK